MESSFLSYSASAFFALKRVILALHAEGEATGSSAADIELFDNDSKEDRFGEGMGIPMAFLYVEPAMMFVVSTEPGERIQNLFYLLTSLEVLYGIPSWSCPFLQLPT